MLPIANVPHFCYVQDTAKSTHYAARDDGKGAQTHVDLNRAGSGLVEIVSGPQMRLVSCEDLVATQLKPWPSRTGEQAAAYVRKVQELLRRVGASDGNMDEVRRSPASESL